MIIDETTKTVLEALQYIAAILWAVYLLKPKIRRINIRKKKKSSKHLTIVKNWTPDGWYYDEKKKKWIAPDFKQDKE